MKGIYFFSDPFGRTNSGVTSYTQIAAQRLSSYGWKVRVVAKQESESIESYRERLASEVSKCGSSVCCVEAPESLASTALISDNIPLHVRLHCSRNLGAAIQGLPYNKEDIIVEQRELDRATFVSAPSRVSLFASKFLFQLRKSVVCYPNPAPIYDTLSAHPPEYDVLFIGRLHRLKGIHHLIEIARKLPHRTFLVAAPSDASCLVSLPRNVQLINGETIPKPKLFCHARMVLVPSIFETVSMVGLEALAAGCPVVTWRHIGLAEYTVSPWVVTASPGNIDELASLVDLVCQQDKLDESKNPIFSINANFDDGIRRLLGKREGLELLSPLPVEVTRHITTMLFSERSAMNQNSTNASTFMRKLRKFRRDPISFFRDSMLMRFAIRPGNRPSSPPVHIEPQKKIEQVVLNSEHALLKVAKLFTQIQLTGKIEFNEPRSKPVGWVTGLFYPVGKKAAVEAIEEGLDNFHDFTCIRKGNLEIGSFDLAGGDQALDIINRIDLANKQRLSKLNNLILIDAPAEFCRALRSCGPDHRLILVLTENDQNVIPEIDCVDALIVVGNDHSAATLKNFRRKLIVEDILQVPLALRRVIQEGGPKSPDMLLPLINGQEYRRNEYMSFNPKFFQGIISVKNSGVPQAASMHELCALIGENVVSLAVLESVYMRYRSVCEEIEQGVSPALLIEYCLYDGVIFHVENAI